MKITASLLIVFVFSFSARAQKGHYTLTHFTSMHEQPDYLSFDLAQDDRGVIYIAGKEGVEEFDGRRWRLIPTPGVTYTVAQTPGSIVVGGLGGYGRLVNQPKNGWTYESLVPDSAVTNIFGSLTLKDKIYLINESRVFIVSAEGNATEQSLDVPADVELTGIFEIMGIVYFSTTDQQLYKLDKGKIVRANFPIPDKQVLFVEKRADGESYLIGTASNRLFIYHGDKGLSELKIQDQEYLDSHIISAGVWVSDQVIAIGTLRGGVIFVNINTKATNEIVDYSTGLPDNEVYTLLSDKRHGIWVGHTYGYTRIATNIPFRSFSHYKGLSGNLLTAQSVNGQLYAGTSVGLFLLTKEEVYDNEVYYVTKKGKASPTAATTQAAEGQPASDERQRSKRGLFGFLKKDKDKSKTEVADNTPKQKAAPPTKTASPTILREKRTRKVLRSLDYAYKKVNGIEGKVTQLWNWNGKLIAGGPSGLYEVSSEKASAISEDAIRSFTLTKDGKTLVAATYDDEVKTFSNANGWRQVPLLDTLHTFVSFLFEDKQENIWLCGLNAIYKAERSDGELVDVVTIPFSNPGMAETFGMAGGSDVFVMIAGKYLRFDMGKEKFVPYDSLTESGKSLVSGNKFWAFNGHKWTSPDPKLDQQFKLEWLNLFPDLRFISPDDKNENLWIITASNELYRFSGNAIPTDLYPYKLFLKEVRNPQTKLAFTSKQVKLSQELGAVTFEFIQPEYSGLQTTEYRYWVQGLQKDWSRWSALNNEISFPFLPVGTYKVLMQSKNLFGEVAEIPPVDFVVVPPYWRQTWFYAAEVAFFSVLVVLSIRLSVMNEKYRIVSRLLSLLTVIMLIELIQTAAYSFISIQSTPVIDFFIQVVIALLMLPLEGTLRNFLEKASKGEFLGKLIRGHA